MDTFRLIFWPSLLTALISTARLVAEVNEWVLPSSGGALHPLGITWLAIVFGGYFAFKLARAGSTSSMRPAWPWALVAMLAIIGSIAWHIGPLRDAPASEASFELLRGAVLMLAAIATTLAVAMFAVWPRLAWTMLCYAVPARLLVVAFTWLAKHYQWNTHYTKFGPMGLERSMDETMLGAVMAQGGFWVPFTVVAGCMVGSFFAKRAAPR